MASISDDFNRADGAVGANWSVDTGNAGDATTVGWRVISNTLRYDGLTRNDTLCLRWVGTALASANYYVEIVIDKVSDSNNAPGPMGRKPAGTGDANSDGYGIAYYEDTTYLMEYTNSGEASLGTYGTTDTAAHTLRLVCDGSRISANIDGTERIAVTGETTYTTGAVGIQFSAWEAAAADTMDNFAAADLAAEAPSPFPPVPASRILKTAYSTLVRMFRVLLKYREIIWRLEEHTPLSSKVLLELV